jgi:hypothetical protein
LFIESNEIFILLIAIYLVLNSLLIFFFIFIHWHLIFISNLVLILFFFSYPFINLISFCYDKFDPHIFKSFFLFNLLFNFIPNYFGWLGIWQCYFSGFAFYGVIRSHDQCHEFWRLDQVGFDLFKFFFLFFYFNFIPQHWVGWRLDLFKFLFYKVILISCRHRLDRFTRVDTGLFYCFFIFIFFISPFNIRLIWELSFTILFNLLSIRLSHSRN